MLLKEYCDGTPLVPAEVRKRWESSYGDKQGPLTLYEATGCDKRKKCGYRGRFDGAFRLPQTRGIESAACACARKCYR